MTILKIADTMFSLLFLGSSLRKSSFEKAVTPSEPFYGSGGRFRLMIYYNESCREGSSK